MFYHKLGPFGEACIKEEATLFKEIFNDVYHQDMLITFDRCMSFMQDEHLLACIEKHAKNLTEKSLLWRVYILSWATKHCLSLPGDFIQCGAVEGFYIAVLADYLSFSKQTRQWQLYCCYEEVVEELQLDHRNLPRREHENCLKILEERTKEYSNISILSDNLTGILKDNVPNEIAFIHLDFKSAMNDKLILDTLFDKLQPGGILIVEDFGWRLYEEQAIKFENYCQGKNIPIVELPTGQGMLFKY